MVFDMVFCRHYVVKCVEKLVCGMSPSGVRKVCQIFEIYFRAAKEAGEGGARGRKQPGRNGMEC